MAFIIAQIISIIGLIFMVFAMQTNQRKKLLLMYIFVSTSYTLTYFLLSAYVAGMLAILSICRMIVFYLFETKEKNCPIGFLILFELLAVVSCCILWNGVQDILVVSELMIVIWTTWQKNMTITRLGYLISSILFIIYNVIVFAYINIISESIALIATLIAIYKFDILRFKLFIPKNKKIRNKSFKSIYN